MDSPMPSEKIFDLRRYQNKSGSKCPPIQKMNHFPGMYEICRKDRLGRNLNRLKRIYPNDYNFFPITWDLPSDMSELLEYWRANRNATFIIKPDSGCQGKGIFLCRNVKSLCPFAKCVAQLYLPTPFLIDGYKFDARLYVLITSVDPLRVYLFEEGIARFATVKYQVPNQQNLDVTFMHLTNYSLNKFSDSYNPQLGGSKRKLTEVYSWMEDHNFDAYTLKDRINDIVVKTIISVAPTLRHNYRASLASFSKKNKGSYCFDVLGFDILIDKNLTPMLLEVNHLPSLNVDLQVDQLVKYDLVSDILDLLYVGDEAPCNQCRIPDQKTLQMERKNYIEMLKRPGTPHGIELNDCLINQFVHEEMNLGGFRMIFREECPGRYARFMDKEYCEAILREQKAFMKKRPEPFNHSDSSWGPYTPPTTTFRRLANGEMLAETKTTSSTLDPHSFLKFKSSVVVHSPITPTSSTNKPSLKSKSRHESTATTAPRTMPTTEQSNSPKGLDESTFREFKILESSLQETQLQNIPTKEKVQRALDKLRKKNLQKIALDRDDGILTIKCRPTSSSPNTKNIDQNNNNNKIDLDSEPDEGVLTLDTSKLPSIFQKKDQDVEKLQSAGQGDSTYHRSNMSNLEMVERWNRDGVLRPPTSAQNSFNPIPEPFDEMEEAGRKKKARKEGKGN